MDRRFAFNGSGGDLFLKFLKGFLLSAITFGIYLPWFVVDLIKWVYANTTLKRPGADDVTFEFTGGGAELFGKAILGWILTMITFGIYGAWFACDMNRWFADHSVGRTAGGETWGLRFNGKGGDLLGTMILGMVLTMVTLGIYGAWFACNLVKWNTENTELLEAGRPAGAFSFDGTGGELFKVVFFGILLTIVTLFIYFFWFEVKRDRFFLSHLHLQAGGVRYTGDFTGTGGQLLVKTLVGRLVTVITLGLYAPWYIADITKWRLENVLVKGGAATGAGLDRPTPFA